VHRAITGFHPDAEGDWVAELSCLHSQHVRHRPPFQPRPWVERAEGRAARVGQLLECPLCGRGELPEGLVVVRALGPFEAATVPAGLHATHRLPAATWGRLRVLHGSLVFSMDSCPPSTVLLGAAEEHAGGRNLTEVGVTEVGVPPEVPHRIRAGTSVRFTLEFMARRAG
jgi:tellurite resistance-related uncharacterized protein